MEKTITMELGVEVETVADAARELYNNLPTNYVPSSVRVRVTSCTGMEHSRGTTIPVYIAAVGAEGLARPVLLPVDHVLSDFWDADSVYLTYSVY